MISNVKVHLKTHSGNVNIKSYILYIIVPYDIGKAHFMMWSEDSPGLCPLPLLFIKGS